MIEEVMTYEDQSFPLIDPETGEVIEATTQFVVDTPEKVDWVLAKMLAAEADAEGSMSNAYVLQAKKVLANARDIEERAQKRLKRLHERFDAELGKYAESALVGKKERTLRTVLGSVSLRNVPNKLTVVNADALRAWAEVNAPRAVSKEVVTTLDKRVAMNCVKAIDPASDDYADALDKAGVKVVPGYTSVIVKAGFAGSEDDENEQSN